MKQKTSQKTELAPSAGSSQGRQGNALGKASREQILKVAEQVLMRDGYHQLSTRKVADGCGISVGNLTYHFPNKVQLMEALMAAVCARYEKDRRGIQPVAARSAYGYVERTLIWMLDDAASSETSSLFLELWVLAKHHGFGTEVLEQFYATAIGWIAEGLKAHWPSTSTNSRQQAAYFMLTLSEGTVAVFSRPYSRSVSQKDLISFAAQSVVSILEKHED